MPLPAHRVEAVDTVGAGDAFNGGPGSSGWPRGLSLVEAATRAKRPPPRSPVTRPGAQGALPTRSDIDRMVLTRRTSD